MFEVAGERSQGFAKEIALWVTENVNVPRIAYNLKLMLAKELSHSDHICNFDLLCCHLHNQWHS